MAQRSDIPGAVELFAEKIDRGHLVQELLLDHRKIDSDDWTKLAACGEPHYLHKPSGWVVVKGSKDNTAILNPDQMENVLTLATMYFGEIESEKDEKEFYGLIESEFHDEIKTMLIEEWENGK